MSSDPLTQTIRQLQQSMLALATIGGELRLRFAEQVADPTVGAAMESVLAALPVPPLKSLSDTEARQALGLIRTFFTEAADLLDDPARAPGWTFKDPSVLQGIGASSAGLVARLDGLAAERPWFAAALARPGTFLDIGTGVGGVALAAAAAWPALDVVGIDPWAPSLALAEQNRRESGCAERVRFVACGLEDVDETERYQVVWLPTPFIAGDVVRAALPRLHRALAPGGVLVTGVIPPPTDGGLGAALGRLRTLRNGGHTWACADVARSMAEAGFADVEIPERQAGIHFVFGRRSGDGARMS